MGGFVPLARLVVVLTVSVLLAACEEKGGTCQPGTVRCVDTCAVLATDARNCGACGVACGGSDVCSGGTCAATCAAPLSSCGTGMDRSCADLRTDSEHCGACGTACATTAVCQAGTCVDTCAVAGTSRCGDACVDLASSGAHCGACGNACGAAGVCRSGSCVDTCALAGVTRCGDVCADLASDAAHCGACGTACAATAVCRSGTCVDGCALAGTTSCGDACVDLAFDGASCGACGNACAATAVCRSGACVDVCTLAGTTRCGGACVDLRADGAHCGACGNACPDWGLCVNGGCAPPLCRNGVVLPEAAPIVRGAPSPTGVLAVDLNGDGLEDLVAYSRWPLGRHELMVALAMPGGGFAPANTYVVAEPGTLVAAHLDADGYLNLNVAGSTTATRLLNDGTGHFVVYPGVGHLLLSVDLDGNGVPDGVFDYLSFGVEVRLAGTTTVQQYPGTWTGLTAVRAADLTGDGRPELVVTRSGGESLDVMLNAGDGTFTVVRYGDPAVQAPSTDVELADVDGDGDLDVVLLQLDRFVVGRNDGAGGLGPFEIHPLPGSAGYYWDLFLADADGDGHVDVLLGTDLGVMLARGAGDGTFGEPHLIRTGTARQLAMTDADRDGRLDVVAATDGGVEVVYGRGGAFPEPASRAFPGTWGLAAVDLDRDGRDDLVALATSTDGSTTVVVLRSGNAAVDAYPAPDATSLAAADLDGDRVPDSRLRAARPLAPLPPRARRRDVQSALGAPGPERRPGPRR